jgi:hypothetical protein
MKGPPAAELLVVLLLVEVLPLVVLLLVEVLPPAPPPELLALVLLDDVLVLEDVPDAAQYPSEENAARLPSQSVSLPCFTVPSQVAVSFAGNAWPAQHVASATQLLPPLDDAVEPLLHAAASARALKQARARCCWKREVVKFIVVSIPAG